MAEVVHAKQAFADLERLFELLAESDPHAASVAVETIQDAISILERHPLIGCPAEQDLRELVISRGRTGYLALYDYVQATDTVLILALRSQREAGYGDDIGPA